MLGGCGAGAVDSSGPVTGAGAATGCGGSGAGSCWTSAVSGSVCKVSTAGSGAPGRGDFPSQLNQPDEVVGRGGVDGSISVVLDVLPAGVTAGIGCGTAVEVSLLSSSSGCPVESGSSNVATASGILGRLAAGSKLGSMLETSEDCCFRVSNLWSSGVLLVEGF